jgi:hypothetical protein
MFWKGTKVINNRSLKTEARIAQSYGAITHLEEMRNLNSIPNLAEMFLSSEAWPDLGPSEAHTQLEQGFLHGE